MEVIYLDHNATTPLRPEVRSAMDPFLGEVFGNPSSLHAIGRAAADAVEIARSQIAAALDVDEATVHFTAGGTEADNWALKGVLEADRLMTGDHRRLLISTVEHHAVLDSAVALGRRGFGITNHPVDSAGQLDPASVMDAVDSGPVPLLVSLLHANNETGVLQPLEQIGAGLRERGILFHIDAVQSFGKVDVHPEVLGADLVSISAHKINGPKGCGALYIRPGVELEPLLHGGGQERGRRPGTLHAAGIVGFGAAVVAAGGDRDSTQERLRRLRDRLEGQLIERIGDVVVHGAGAPRLANTLNVSFRGVEAEAVLLGLDQAGVAAASGSACTSGRPEPSHVLLAMGVEPRLAAGAVRFSLGWGNDEAQIDAVLEQLPPIIARLRDLSVF
ncbi:MAG: cysteine desulfurase [Gemmatimonadetes bacterium]|jgi:cysteine desulfurase|nr:cysteine desulfurase [Gemmatimonadota bacterium]MBT6144389.1 cysteine desulfurase [Gemmatimonadota bacterium]MBT7859891.1 cysteine desulfurase [Gemmatimonadota bacterium]